MAAKAKLKAKTTPARKQRRKPTAGRAGKRGEIGSTFDDFLRDDGIYEETQAIAVKRVIAWALAREMAKNKISKSEMAARMETSRSQLDRLLDPDNEDVKLNTLARAARAVNCKLRVELVAG